MLNNKYITIYFPTDNNLTLDINVRNDVTCRREQNRIMAVCFTSNLNIMPVESYRS